MFHNIPISLSLSAAIFRLGGGGGGGGGIYKQDHIWYRNYCVPQEL